jgi:hypothetical protein
MFHLVKFFEVKIINLKCEIDKKKILIYKILKIKLKIHEFPK